jgi:hypothetical protein
MGMALILTFMMVMMISTAVCARLRLELRTFLHYTCT